MAKTTRKYQVRRCSDLELIKRLDREIFHGDEALTPGELSTAVWWVIFHRGEAVGFGGATLFEMGKLGHSGFLRRAGVCKGHRGFGLQKRLIRVRDRWVKSQGAAMCITYTSGDNFPSSNNLIACGYKLYDPIYRYGLKGAFYWIKYHQKPKA